MHPTQHAATPGADPLEDQAQARLEDLNSGKYRQNTDYVLHRFANWCRDRGVAHVEDVDAKLCRRYARGLSRDVDEGNVSKATAHQYWAYVRSFLSWAVREQLLETNPADTNEAEEPLPEEGSSNDQQFWTARERKAICVTADRRVDEALEDDGTDPDVAYRDRALIYTLAWSGCRGAELVRESADEERDGIVWDDIDLEKGIVEVMGKSRSTEQAPLLSPAHEPLQKWRTRADPEDDDAVFSRLDPVARGRDAASPAITTESLRTTLAELCETSDYRFDRVLKPHGARRGLGHELYEESAELAQEALRHKTIETTHDSYRDEQAAQTRRSAEDVLLGDDE